MEFSSHGAYIEASGARCYVSLSELGEPAPRRARDVFQLGDVLDALDVAAMTAQRRITVPFIREVLGEP